MNSMASRGPVLTPLFAMLFACGCNGILGIEEMHFNPDATTGPDAGNNDGMGPPVLSDATVGDAPSPAFDGGSDALGATDGIAASDSMVEMDAPVAACTEDGSAGSVCGTVTYGSWSACSYGATCDNSGSRTRSVMTPTCAAGACSVVTTSQNDTSGCARNTNGTNCGTNEACNNGTCACAPACASKNCGPDGCGGSCGSCSGGNYYCDGTQTCQCTPNAGCVSGGGVGNVCGADDGCGGPCTCDGANGESCGTNNICCHNDTQYCFTNGDCCSNNCVGNACQG
jgi:hypothetical protein